MTEQEKSTVFGQVLAEYLERRGFPADDEHVRNLAASAGLEDPERFLGRVRGEDMDYISPIGPVADLLGLSEPEMLRLAMAHYFERAI
jgi:hypothetical protein